MKNHQQKNVAVFASGNGTNAEKIFKHFTEHPLINISLLLTNNSNAPVIDRAKKHKIPVTIFDRSSFYETTDITEMLLSENIDLIVLAGFMWLIPPSLVKAFPDKIINIHPALLPKYGGKGMYGSYVHEAVIAAQEQESGITIHFVNEKYDEGNIIFQKKCAIDPNETADSLATKIHKLEHTSYPQVIENLLLN